MHEMIINKPRDNIGIISFHPFPDKPRAAGHSQDVPDASRCATPSLEDVATTTRETPVADHPEPLGPRAD